MNKKKIKNALDKVVYDFIRIQAVPPAMIWMRPRVLYCGEKPSFKGGFMVMANHCGLFDPIVVHTVFWWRRIYSLASKDLYYTPFRSFLFKSVNCIQVDKENFSLNSLHEVTKRLKQGKIVSIFPEGRLNIGSDDVLSFKSGVVLMAHSAKVPIIPLYVVQAKKWYNRYTIVIGQPINVQEECGRIPTINDLERVCSICYDKEQELRDYYLENYC